MKNIQLSDEQANKLSMVLIMSGGHISGEAETWKELSKEHNDDGTPKYTNAESNSRWYSETLIVLKEIQKILDQA